MRIPASHTAIDLSSEPETMRLLSAEKWIERTVSLCAFCCSAASSRENHLARHDSSWGSHDPVQASKRVSPEGACGDALLTLRVYLNGRVHLKGVVETAIAQVASRCPPLPSPPLPPSRTSRRPSTDLRATL